MRINNKPLESFHMKVNSFTYQPFSIERQVFQPDYAVKPVMGRLEIAPKEMKLVAEFRSKLDISNFLAELLKHKENILDVDDGFLYRCFLFSVKDIVDEYWQGWYRITVTLSVIQEGSRRKIYLKKARNNIHVAGNWTTDCLFEITPKKNLETFTIFGYEIRRLYKDRTVYLDGETKRVYTSSEPNKYSDCVLKNKMFPCLDPGQQTINMNNVTDVTVVLKYTPIYI